MYGFFGFLMELPEIIEYWGLPRGCWHCELLGICRRPKKEGWKCYDGCMVLNCEHSEEDEEEPLTVGYDEDEEYF